MEHHARAVDIEIASPGFPHMHILHVALGGCLESPQVSHGITQDTGGHIAYVLGAATAQASPTGWLDRKRFLHRSPSREPLPDVSASGPA